MNYLNNSISSGVSGDSGLQLNNVEVLYTKVQRVYIKPQHKEERQRELRVNVEIHAGLSPVCRKVMLHVVIILTYTYYVDKYFYAISVYLIFFVSFHF